MPTTLGDRIEKALAHADMTVKDLETALEDEGVDGGSYANLHRLKSNKMERPSAGLLYGIAKATGVRLPWLVAHDGPPTAQEERGWEEMAGVTRADVHFRSLDRYRTLAFEADVLNALGIATNPPPAPPEEATGEDGPSEEAVRWSEAIDDAFASRPPRPWAGALAEVRRRLRQGHRTPPVEGTWLEADDLGRALRGPLEALDVDPDRMPLPDLWDYVLAMAPVLLALAPERRRQIEQRADDATTQEEES